MDKPLCIDLFCGLGGWADGFLAEGWRVVGYDVEAHDYGTGGYPGELVLRDVRSITGAECAEAAVIVASPPCQAYSYRAMPWSRAKVLPPPDNSLFNECFRIQRDASAAAGRYIPLVVENVRGAQKWVGRARWHYGSFYLWGDVPALMPITIKAAMKSIGPQNLNGEKFSQNINKMRDCLKTVGHANIRDGHTHARHLTNPRESEGIKQAGISGVRDNGKGDKWFQDGAARPVARSSSRKAASNSVSAGAAYCALLQATRC